jgi:LacI family transcriptional regulator
MERVTLNSIAKEAGVSKTTASFVLNGKGTLHKINAETQKRILDLANQYNYQPSFLAKTLSSGKTMTVGFMAADPQNHFTSLLIQETEKQLDTINYRLLLGFSYNQPEKEADILNDFITRSTDAIIVFAPCDLTNWLQKTKAPSPPIMVIGNNSDNLKIPTLAMDFKDAVNLLLQEHLRKHKKAIGFIGDHTQESQSCEAIYDESYTERFDIKSSYKRVINGTDNLLSAIKDLINNKINALILATPDLAMKTLQLVHEHPFLQNADIDISTIGWHQAFTYSTPCITGCNFQPSLFGENIKSVILEMLSGNTRISSIHIPPVLNQTIKSF